MEFVYNKKTFSEVIVKLLLIFMMTSRGKTAKKRIYFNFSYFFSNNICFWNTKKRTSEPFLFLHFKLKKNLVYIFTARLFSFAALFFFHRNTRSWSVKIWNICLWLVNFCVKKRRKRENSGCSLFTIQIKLICWPRLVCVT